MQGSDQKSLFGILVAIVAIFGLWLWGSGRWAKFWAATTNSGSPTFNAGGGNIGGNGASGSWSSFQIPVQPTNNELTFANYFPNENTGTVQPNLPIPQYIQAPNITVPNYQPTQQPTQTGWGVPNTQVPMYA